MTEDTPLQDLPTTTRTPDPADQEESRSARDVTQALVKTLKAQKMYLPEHVLRRRFQDELHSRFERHFETFGELALTVKPYELWCGSKSVYEEPSRFENLAFRCFADGLREITFHPGLTTDDIEWFVRVIGADAQPLDDDIVTRLWDRGSTHITYRVAEVGEGDPDGTEEGWLRGAPPTARSATPVASEGATETPPPSGEPVLERPTGAGCEQQVYMLSEEEVKALQEDVHADAREDYVEQLIEILVSILELEDDTETCSEVLEILREMVAGSLRMGVYRQAVAIVHRFANLAGPASRLSPEGRASIRRVWESLGTWEQLSPVQEVINQHETWDVRELLEYLRLLPPSSIPALITLMEQGQTAKGRRVVCDALIAVGWNEVEAFVERLRSAHWYLRRNLIYILGCCKNPSALPALEASIDDPEVRIRREVFKALESIGGQRVTELVPRFLDDHDESVRLLAMRGLRTFPSAQGIDTLSAMVLDKAFLRRSRAEQQEIFDTLADAGSDAMLPFLGQFLVRKKVWPWKAGEAHELRSRYALAALRRIATPKALDLLREVGVSSGKIPDEARRALHELERSTKRTGTR